MELRDLLHLGRWKVSLAASLSAATGSAVFQSRHALGPELLVPAAGTMLLAMGASALNQLQERDIDARMARTCGRPLPSGRVTPAGAGLAAGLLLTAGFLALALGAGWTAASLGGAAVAWYNGVYTYLKRVTAFAVLPGALVGAIPPAIGWAGAGGGLLERPLLALCLALFLWQIPHFWLILLRYGGEYEAAGLPSLTAVFTPAQLDRLAVPWLGLAGLSLALQPLVATGVHPGALLHLAAGLSLPAAAVVIANPHRPDLGALASRAASAYLVLVLGILAAGRLWRVL